MLVDDAHHQLGLPKPKVIHTSTGRAYPESERRGRLPCMIGHADSRTLDVWLPTGKPLEFEAIERQINLKEGPALEARYGVRAADIFGASNAAEDRLRSLFAAARTMFEKDGYYITIAFLLRDGRPVDIRELRPGEHGHKYLMMRSLAHEVAKHGADAVILISESWSAPADPSKLMMRAIDSPNRRELLTGTVVSKAAEPLALAAEIKRDGKVVTLDATVEARGGAHFAFAPVYEVWGKALPADWASGTTSDGAAKGIEEANPPEGRCSLHPPIASVDGLSAQHTRSLKPWPKTNLPLLRRLLAEVRVAGGVARLSL